MDSRYYQDKINRLDKDIADIEKKIAAESKIEADRSSKIAANINNAVLGKQKTAYGYRWVKAIDYKSK